MGLAAVFSFAEQGFAGSGKAWFQLMAISLIFRIAAVGILITILNQILKHSGREDHAFLISLAGLILVLTWILPYIYELFMMIQNLFEL